ncbi:MAG: SHOCT domain-containing protein [Chloroflexota bacterium]
MYGWTMGIDGWLWMGAWMLVLVVAVALLVWAPRRGRETDEPIDVLRGRLARGEITAEEFERARSLLAAGPTTEGKAHR